MIILTIKVYPKNGPEECQSMFKWEFVLKNQEMFREYIALNHPIKKIRTNLTGNRIGHND